MLDIDEHKEDPGFEVLAPEAQKGGQLGLLADLDADGAQEMALVLAGGGLWVLRRAAVDPMTSNAINEPALAVSVALPPGAAGPVTVTARSNQEERFLGARNVTRARGAFVGLREEGAVTLEWRWPGGAAQKKKLLVLDGRVRFVLPPPKP